jgi:hypothetical protein
MMESEEPRVKDFGRLIAHVVLVSLFLAVWLTTAWAIDNLLMEHFPLQGMSMISFRLLEVIVHLSTLRAGQRLLFTRHKRNIERWWL